MNIKERAGQAPLLTTYIFHYMSHYSTPEDGLQGVRQEFMENCQFLLYSSGVPFHWKQKWRKTRMKCKRFIKKGK
ncbi:MAG: hypothetical protein IIU74_04185, partial [Ruminiclostridium sp.]|nr:hypothetical protein [Ruminiclostridium sp.]